MDEYRIKQHLTIDKCVTETQYRNKDYYNYEWRSTATNPTGLFAKLIDIDSKIDMDRARLKISKGTIVIIYHHLNNME